MEIAICITTRNRHRAFEKCLGKIYEFMPPNSDTIVIDDASTPAYCVSDFRFNQQSGIARAKNKCLELAMNTDARHFFLFDDDCYPISGNWHLPYINSPHPHLCYTFLPHYKTVSGHKMHSLGNGCMLYIQRNVVEKIGGFDTRFGLAKYEHNQFSYRAYAAGLIPNPYIDIAGSQQLLHSMDENNEVQRSFTKKEMARMVKEGKAHFDNTRMTTEFIPYKS